MPRYGFFAVLCTVLLTACGADTESALNGVVTGRLISLGCDEPVADARLAIAGTGCSTTTDADGKFHFELPSGRWVAGIEAEGLLPGQSLDDLLVVAGTGRYEGEFTVLPTDLPEVCADGEPPHFYAGGTPDVEQPGAWDIDERPWPDLAPGEDLDLLEEELPAEDELPVDEELGTGEEPLGSEGQPLVVEEDEAEAEAPADPARVRAPPVEHAHSALAGDWLPELDPDPSIRAALLDASLAEPGDPPELVTLLADLEALHADDGDEAVLLEGVELPEGVALPEPAMDDAPNAGDDLDTMSQELGRCGTIRLQRVSGSGVSDSYCHRVPDGTPLERYVRGVVGAEVMVLAYDRTRGGTRLIDRPKRLEHFFRTFAVAARTYVVKRTGNARAVRVVSGPTFQCYRRMASFRPLDRAIRATKGQFLATRGGGRMLTSEYAASCTVGHTRPEGENGYVGASGYLRDRPRVALWRGGRRQHAGCGGHEGGGPCPVGGINTTSNRRVRGVCQTGAAERAMSGHGYAKILGHYQPQAQLCGAGPVAGRLVPLSPKDVTLNAGYRLRFRWRDTALERTHRTTEYVLHLRDLGRDKTRHFHLYRRGRDVERWSAASVEGGSVVTWVPSAELQPLLRARGRYEWWVTRLKGPDAARQVSPKVRFRNDEGLETIYVVRRKGDDVRGERFDATLVVPPRREGGRPERVGYLDRGMSGRYPWAVLDLPSDAYRDGPLTFTLYEAVRGTGPYRFYVYDYRHPGSTRTRDLRKAGTAVVVAKGRQVWAFRAPEGGYNYWEVFHMGGDLVPDRDGHTAYCDFRTETPTCVDARP